MQISARNAWCLAWLLAVVVGCGVGCGGGSRAASSQISSGGEEVLYAGAIASTDVPHGKELFDRFCGDCHPDGTSDVGPSLIDQPNTPSRIRKQIREGSGKMRPFSEKRLAPADVESILAWLATVNAVR